MRMWMVDVKVMCRQHLLGEHNELHMLVGCIRKKKSIRGYIDKKIVSPRFINIRHEQVSREMVKRGYNHQSPLWIEIWELWYLGSQDMYTLVDEEESLKELMTRCEECKMRWKNDTGGTKSN